MNELHHRRQIEALVTPIVQSATHQQHEGGPQALAARCDDVLRHLGNQRHVGLKPAGNDRVHGAHVIGDQSQGGSGA